ncbi:hypothetical protein SH580_06950 [Coraliomargarita algicola]|uniref:Uncharacterized protein n=1 Tax=Coraliomargarita algicola TaxID=3092156 RepID=A0ABZ0RRC0_9BACT|nr:hypothetical protein [Coraliomargarita sp. J2-16]WPJ97447.1 hypothetical protein SH580_06950 [Coraliomargarita sp. J2-16]
MFKPDNATTVNDKNTRLADLLTAGGWQDEDIAIIRRFNGTPGDPNNPNGWDATRVSAFDAEVETGDL